MRLFTDESRFCWVILIMRMAGTESGNFVSGDCCIAKRDHRFCSGSVMVRGGHNQMTLHQFIAAMHFSGSSQSCTSDRFFASEMLTIFNDKPLYILFITFFSRTYRPFLGKPIAFVYKYYIGDRSV